MTTQDDLWDALPDSFFGWKGLRVTVDRETRTLWFEGLDAPLTKETAGIIRCLFQNEPSESEALIIATGTREQLEDRDALIKIVLADNRPGAAFAGRSNVFSSDDVFSGDDRR